MINAPCPHAAGTIGAMDEQQPHDVTLPDGTRWPALGIGTWGMGEAPARRAREVAAVRTAVEIGYRLIDTAEMYGEGGAEVVVGDALHGAFGAGDVGREDLVVVSKVYPHNASAAGVVSACERSLRRLRLEHLDLYLLHWRGGVPLADTVRGFESLQRRGLVRHWGVSNFDVDDLRELGGVPGGTACAANQVYYSLGARGVEFDLLPWQRLRRMPLMAYSPIDQGALADNASLRSIAERHGVTPARIALAWLLSRPGVMAIPKAVKTEHLRDNWAAARIALDAEDQAALDRMFPPPAAKQPLAML
jgi:diketogulonate reductase-like aldo/keto reductase